MTHADCLRCLDAGVVEAKQANFTTLALCLCKQGRKQPWNLPHIPLTHFTHEPLDWREYKPSKERPRREIEAWHIQRVRNAEEYWNTPKEPT